MKKILLISISLLLFNCLKNSTTSITPGGDLEVVVQLNKIGLLAKRSQSLAALDPDRLILKLYTSSGDSVQDTTLLSTGSANQYSRNFLALETDVTWFIEARVLDQNGVLIYGGLDSIFLANGTSESVFLNLSPNYSEFSISIYPLPDSAATLSLIIDDSIFIDSSVASLSSGSTVSFFYDYLSSSPEGEEHRFQVNIHGQKFGNDTLLYHGDTTITVYSSQVANLMFLINYVGPNSTDEFQLNAKVFLNEVGSVNGVGFVDTSGEGDLSSLLDTLQFLAYDLNTARGSNFNAQVFLGPLDSNLVVFVYQLRNSTEIVFSNYVSSFNENSELTISEPIPEEALPGDDYYFILFALDKTELWDAPRVSSNQTERSITIY